MIFFSNKYFSYFEQIFLKIVFLTKKYRIDFNNFHFSANE